MSIASKRLLAYLDSLTQTAMREGYLPNPAELQQDLEIYAREHQLTDPQMQYQAQPWRGQFDVDKYNTMVLDTVEDLNFAFAEQVDQVNRLLKALSDTDIRYQAFLHQIETVDDLLEVLLLAEPRASGYFYALTDRFRNMSLIDLNQTTADIDLLSGSVHLPTLGSTRKIPMPHLARRTSVSVSHKGVVRTVRAVPGNVFGYAFDDTVRGWQHQVFSDSNAGWEGYFTVPVSVKESQTTSGGATLPQVPTTEEIYISRVDLDGLSGTEMDVKVLYSVDGRNFVGLPGQGWVTVSGRRQSLFFERIRVEFLRFMLRKHLPDEEIARAVPGTPPYYGYTIGFRNISIYDAGFAREAELFSKQLDPEISIDIGRVVLDAEEYVPAGTDIEYYVAAYSSAPTWHRIQPLGRHDTGALPLLDFTEAALSPRRDNLLNITSTPTLNSSRLGINFYNIGTLNGNQITDTAKLYRGVGGWKKESNLVEETVSVKNNYVAFTQADNFQYLYIEVKEETVQPPASDGTNDTTIRVTRPILQDDSLQAVPSSDMPVDSPDYSIKEVLLLKATGETGAGTIAITTNADESRTTAITLTGMPANTVNAGDYIRIAQGTVAKFFKILLATKALSDETSWYLQIDDPDRELTNGAATWLLNTLDITSKAQDIDGDTFKLSSSVTLTINDRLLVTYRSPLAANEVPVSSSVVAKSDEAGGTVYRNGRDYVFDADKKAISRNPDGAIRVTGDSKIIIRVDFQYKRDVGKLDTYTTFLKYDGDGSDIQMASAISVDDTIGEGVYLQANEGTVIDLSRVSKITGLVAGWRRLIVKSRPAADANGTTDTTSAIYKVINALDENTNYLFGPRHFAEQRGWKSAMNPTNLFYLQTSVGKDDRDLFAIDSNNVVVNYNPADSVETLYLQAGSSTIQKMERFQVEYMYSPSDTAVTSLLLKAVLKRGEGFNTDRTPVLSGYTLRLAH